MEVSNFQFERVGERSPVGTGGHFVEARGYHFPTTHCRRESVYSSLARLRAVVMW
jgi:hypothetical protein